MKCVGGEIFLPEFLWTGDFRAGGFFLSARQKRKNIVHSIYNGLVVCGIFLVRLVLKQPAAARCGDGGRLEHQMPPTNLAALTQSAPYLDNPRFQRLRDLVQRIQSGDSAASEELYHVLRAGIGWYVARQLGGDGLEDTVHDVFLAVLTGIQENRIRKPECAFGYIRSVSQRTTAGRIHQRALRRRREVASEAEIGDTRSDAESSLLERERILWMERLMGELEQRDREILVRFYLQDQDESQIRAAMGLSSNQFRLRKSRAKARFLELSKQQGSRSRLAGLSTRSRASSYSIEGV